MTRSHARRAFTLIELLLVLVILAVLAAVVVPKLAGRVEDAKRGGTIAEISNIKSVLNTFEIDNGRYPSSEEGLMALLQCPADLTSTWKGPYLDKFPTDKWGHDYIYRYPGTDDPTSFELISMGRDGQLGTDDDINKNTER
jgi:general secretion pathway protein G